MAHAKITVDQNTLQPVLSGLKYCKAEAPKAMAWAINRTLSPLHTAVSRAARQRFAIKAGDFPKKKESITKASAQLQRYYGSVDFSGQPIPLIKWRAKQTKRGVSATIIKGAGRKLYRRAFIVDKWEKVKSRSSHRRRKTGRWSRSGAWTVNGKVVFQRERGAGRLPVDVPFGPSVPGMLNERLLERPMQEAQERLEREMVSRVNYILRKQGLA